jgi:outer membrane biosynthesis protein TonB
MNRAVVALLVSVSLLGCFPHSARNRRYAQLGEGAAILAGIAISAVGNTAADCDEMKVPGTIDTSCETNASWMSGVGVVLIVGGLLGFVATVSTAEKAPPPKPLEIKAETPAKPEEKPAPAPAPAATEPAPAPAPTDNTQATDPNTAGSASTTPSAPQK